ncbi:hypothetical protein [Reichenbachiella agariperforans]|uniref:hypothetical protein n=1 Tax=Reichenbachiella agariperforans TaxID=156994 RepID=UPI001C09F3F7|nr:hypothetical protein [Reichenbachiella agariperforans]MBU2912712.1 hypothetical protein [Reichenbachiella agariperforans]
MIKSPEKIKQLPLTVFAFKTSSFEYTDPIHSFPMTKSITTVSMGQIGIPNSNVSFGGKPSESQIVEFGGMQALIKSCVDNAEDIKDRIHSIIISKKGKVNEGERIQLMKMDFMSIKQWFMDDIRQSKIYQEFKNYNSTKKLKPFSKDFNTFILDRNKYTHGQLCFLLPDYEFIIEYIETPSQQKQYAHIDFHILQSYNSCYKEILSVISEYNIIHQNRILKEPNKA